MPWGAQTWAAFVPEPSYGKYAGSLSTAVYITMVGGNSFTPRKEPIRQIVRTADGGNRRKFVVGSRRRYQGTLHTVFQPDQGTFWATAFQSNGLSLATAQSTIAAGAVTAAAFPYTTGTMGSGYTPSVSTIPVSFVGACTTPAAGTATSNSSGQIIVSDPIVITTPGTGYTSPPGVIIGGMPSYTIVYWDGVRVWEFLGSCVQNATITTSATQDYATLSVNWICQTLGTDFTSTGFAQPAANLYSALNPYLFIESAGLVKLTTFNNTPVSMPLTNYRQMSWTLNNVLQGTWDELANITSLLYCGRDMDFTIQPQYIGQSWPATNPGSALYQTLAYDYENQSPLTWSLEFSRPSVSHSFTINAQTNSYISNMQYDIPLDNASYQNCTVQAFIDSTTTAGYDFQITAT
jgi:hypothetical protein